MSEKTIVEDADGNVVTITKAPQRVFVDFTRTLNLGDFNSAKVSVNMEVPLPLDATSDDTVDGIRSAFLVAKAAAFEQLGIAYDIEDRIAIEALQAAGLNATEVTKAQEQAAVTAHANRPAAKTTDREAAAADLVADIKANGLDGLKGWFNNVEDSRGTKKPQFKSKTTNRVVEGGVGIWIDKNAELKALVNA